MADANAQYVTSPLSISPPLVESPSTLAFGDTLPRTATELSTPKPNAAWLGKQQQRQWIPDLNDPVLKDNRTLVLYGRRYRTLLPLTHTLDASMAQVISLTMMYVCLVTSCYSVVLKHGIQNLSIVQIMALLKKDDPSKQKVYCASFLFSFDVQYISSSILDQAGVGTYKGATASTPGAVSKVFDLMIANTLGAHVRDGYAFLMDNCGSFPSE
jgi:hypothetical protein